MIFLVLGKQVSPFSITYWSLLHQTWNVWFDIMTLGTATAVMSQKISKARSQKIHDMGKYIYIYRSRISGLIFFFSRCWI